MSLEMNRDSKNPAIQKNQNNRGKIYLRCKLMISLIAN